MLKCAIKYGYELVKVHRVIKYTQCDYIKKYIELNTSYRSQAKNDFEKDLYKLLNNIIYGKSNECVENRTSYEITGDYKRAKKLNEKPMLKSAKYVEGIYYYESYRKTAEYNKPLYIGVSVLNLSKNYMYDFVHSQIKNIYDKCSVLYTDTDSVVLEIETNEDVYKNMIRDKHLYDLSGMRRSDFVGFEKHNKATLKKMKCETGGVPIVEYIANGPKSYWFNTIFDKSKTTLKGVQKAVKDTIGREQFLECLDGGDVNVVVNGIVCDHHKLFTYKKTKTALTKVYDKMTHDEDGGLLPYGFNEEL
jgi:hypothetical protein